MFDSFAGSLADIAVLVLAAIASAGFIAAGVFVELIASSHLLGGDLYLGLWEAAFGLILLYAGVWVLGYHEVWSRLVALRTG